MRKIGINMGAIGGLPVEDYIKALSDLGFSATFSMPFENEKAKKISALCAKHGICFETIHAPFRGINRIWSKDPEGDAMLTELIDAVESCIVMEAPILVVHLSSGENAPSITDVGRDRFARLVDYACTKNVKIAFENQRKLANLAWSLETFGPDVAGFCWDCGHEGCFTPGREYMPLFSDRLICTHIHDNRGIYNGDDHMLPFDGALDFDRIAAQLRHSPFDGTLMLEVLANHSSLYDNVDPIAYLERAAQAAKKLAEMI